MEIIFFFFSNYYLHEGPLLSIQSINALNGPIVTDGFSEHYGQDLHVTGMNQSQKEQEAAYIAMCTQSNVSSPWGYAF